MTRQHRTRATTAGQGAGPAGRSGQTRSASASATRVTSGEFRGLMERVHELEERVADYDTAFSALGHADTPAAQDGPLRLIQGGR